MLSKDVITHSVNTHLKTSVLLAMTPISFFLIIALWSGETQMLWVLALSSPIIALGACAHLLRRVLTDIHASPAPESERPAGPL
ncbi:hypothetical protein [Alteromonas halophila]|uniref:Uncharacterized protein n=1 Tax=Alteromonas halophila TaxID=516698 RepID=A0A918JGG3_9ALTE|nr:hypothetical protein [Alteromonas halophila]GGW79619.1 hypothetical protein GCM10007391_10510 [Alteromonas halophila]